MIYDFAVIGGGIVGLSTAVHLLERFPGRTLLLLEKEESVAAHQTGRNSGVIHAGVYYEPGSLKARFCREGAQATQQFCREQQIPYERCGKLLVATNSTELARMEALRARCQANDIQIEQLDAAGLRQREPHITGLGALFVPATGIVDYGKVAAAMARVIEARGGEIRLRQAVESLQESQVVSIGTRAASWQARVVVACGGLMADRLAALCGLAHDFRIIPFRGEYYRLAEHRNRIVSHLIYPIPDPAMPFLGVHLTRMIDGGVTVGPNAVLGMAREGYDKLASNARDVLEMLRFAGFWRLARRHFRTGVTEQINSLHKPAYLALCRKYCPQLLLEDLLPHPTGIRAQAVTRAGELLHDFLIRRTRRTIHVCNAPSPGATSAIPIGRHIARATAGLLDDETA